MSENKYRDDGVPIGIAILILLGAYFVASFIALIFAIPYPW
jgi:hypothetical protein